MMIKRYDLPIGAARREGRAPSHDGEYISIYYRPGSTDWLGEDNGGGIYSKRNTLVDATRGTYEDAQRMDELLIEMALLDREIREAVVGDWGDIATGCGCAVRDAMIEWGWIKSEQWDGGHLFQ